MRPFRRDRCLDIVGSGGDDQPNLGGGHNFKATYHFAGWLARYLTVRSAFALQHRIDEHATDVGGIVHHVGFSSGDGGYLFERGNVGLIAHAYGDDGYRMGRVEQ
jgi:hypothetical protein